MSAELPEGWASRKPLAVAQLIRGVSYEKGEVRTEPMAGHVALLRANNITNDGLRFTDLQFVPEARVVEDQRLRVGDVVVAMSSGSKAVVGKAASLVQPWDGTFGAFCGVLRPNPCIDSAFFGLFFRTRDYRRGISELSAGTNINNLKREYFDEFALPLPPIGEQQRIVTQVEALLEQVNRAKGRLDRVPLVLKRFRQAVLAAAFSGELTEEWRAERGREDESWTTSTVEAVCTTIVDCPHSTPKWTDAGERCLRTTNFFVNGLDLREVRFVSVATYTERVSRLVPAPGDIVYSREGGILGIACVIPAGLKACLGQRMMLMRPDVRRIRSNFLCAVLNSPATNAVVRDLTGGSAAPHLNVGDIKKFDVPLPELDEQAEIVRRVEKLFALADTVERRVKAATARAEKLPQAILSKAFSGELVPTEAELARAEGRTYETAEELLKRVAAATAERTPKTRRGRPA